MSEWLAGSDALLPLVLTEINNINSHYFNTTFIISFLRIETFIAKVTQTRMCICSAFAVSRSPEL